MREIIELDELQSILKDILSVFADYCDSHNLFYSLYGGTMLGAVRHHDIIPWDDDVDVCMPRPDYEKLIALQSTDPVPGCTLFVPGMKNYIYPYLKVSLNGSKVYETFLEEKYSVFGIYIDVFPMDGYPVNYSETQFLKICDELESYKRAKGFACIDYRRKKSLLKLVYNFANRCFYTKGKKYDYFLEKMVNTAKRTEFCFEDADYLMCLYSAYARKLKIMKKDFMERRLYQFGNRTYYGVKDFDKYLAQLYGDYMKLPPVEKRKSIHQSKFYKDERKIVTVSKK